MTTPSDAAPASSPAHPRRWLMLAAALVGSASLGAALAPYLAVHQPLVLLALNRGRVT
jgi:uncharacterized protein involved in exopolysaccharide biosynthesis